MHLGSDYQRVGISSRIKVYLIDLLSGNVHKALNPFLNIPHCLYCIFDDCFYVFILRE